MIQPETLILDIQELYQIIPECKKLEGKNFKDKKELLVSLIKSIESTNEWVFVQYVPEKPASIFIIRKIVPPVIEHHTETIREIEVPIIRHIDKTLESIIKKETKPEIKRKIKEEKVQSFHSVRKATPKPNIMKVELPWQTS